MSKTTASKTEASFIEQPERAMKKQRVEKDKDEIEAERLLEMGNDILVSRHTDEELLRALSLIIRSAELDETNPLTFLRLGSVYNDLYRYQEAINPLTKVIEIDSRLNYTYAAYNELGKAYKGLDRYQEAADQYTKAIAHNSIAQRDYDWYDYGGTYARAGQYKKAFKYLFEDVETRIRGDDDVDDAGPDSYLEGAGIFDLSLSEISISIEEKLNLVIKLIILLNKALIAKGIGKEWANVNIADALVEYTECTGVGKEKLIKEAVDLYYIVGNQYMFKKDYAKALELYNKAIKLNPKFLDLYVQAETVCTKTGQVAEAEKHHIKASELFEPTSKEVHRILLEINSQLKPMIPSILDYLFNPTETEMSGADSIMAAIDDL